MWDPASDMYDLLTSPPYVPFSAAVAILLGLLALEVLLLVTGVSLLGDADGPDAVAEVPDLGAAELDALDAGTAAPAGFELADGDGPAAAGAGTGHWTGLGRVPFLIWLTAALAGFAIGGLLVQATGPWTLWVAVPVAAASGLGAARAFAGIFARAVPRLETAALDPRQLARRRGTVSQGTARRGRPAELRVVDRYGNTHWVRAEPLREADAIPQGTAVLTVWDRRAAALRIVSLE